MLGTSKELFSSRIDQLGRGSYCRNSLLAGVTSHLSTSTMTSGIKKFFLKTKSTAEGKATTKLEALLLGTLRLTSSRSVSHKEIKENERIREKSPRDLDREGNTNSRRIPMRSSLSQKRYPTELCSPCDPPDKGYCLEQKLSLLSRKEINILESSNPPLSQSTLTGSLHQSSYESVAESLQYSEEYAHGSSDMTPVSANIESDDQQASEDDVDESERYNTPEPVLNLKPTQQSKRIETSEVLMNVLSHHQIEWAAMMELEKVDSTGILRGLSSRQIRWLVRESRCRTWLVGTLGPLPEERSCDAIELKNVNNHLENIDEQSS